MQKYGVENFSFEILLETYDLDYWEKKFIFWYDSTNPLKGYNLSKGGEVGWGLFNSQVKKGLKKHPMTNHIWTEKQRFNMSVGRKGISSNNVWKRGERKWSQEELENNRQKHLGKTHSEITKEKLRKLIKGKHFYNNGKINVLAFECPPEFKKGKIAHKKSQKLV